MKNTVRTHHTLWKLLIGSALISSFGCSAGTDSSDSTAASLSLSGSLSLSSTTQSFASQKLGVNPITSLGKITDEQVSAMSLDLTTFTVSCVTTSTPIRSGTGAVAADGSFSISIEGGTNQPLSCSLVDAQGDRQADFIISDSSKKDLNGASQISGTTTYTRDANLGSVTFDPNAGEVTVPKSNIADAVNDTAPSSASVFDPTGTWTISAVDFTLPSGVKGPCTGGGGGGGGCQGPPDGQAIYLKLWQGLQTATGADIHGLQVWESPSQFASCGSKIGLTSAIKTEIGVDFSANGSADAPFSFVSSVASFNDQITSATGTVNLTDNWKMDTATAQWNINPNCGPRDITIGGISYNNAWICGPDLANNYQMQLGGGCVQDSNGSPVQLNDWSGISCGSMSVDGDGIRTMSCTGSAMINSVSTAVTCSNKWVVTDSAYAVISSSGTNFNWNDMNASQISSGTLCSAIPSGTESGRIAQLQCYAHYYYMSGMERASACLPRIDMDWSATTSANFVIVDEIRPSGLIFFEQYKPFADGNGGTMITRQEHYNGVQVNGNSWVNCRVIEIGGLTIKKISDTKMLATYQQSTVTTSTTKPACMAEFTGARETFVFYINKN